MTDQQQHERTLSDDDVEAIADKLLEKWEAKFYHNIGKGVWDVVKKFLFVVLLGIAAYGAATGGKFTWPSGTP